MSTQKPKQQSKSIEQTENKENPKNTKENKNQETWPRFLIVEGSDSQSLSKLSPFAINKAIQGMVGSVKNIKKLRSGHLLVEVDQKSHATNLLKTQKLAGVAVKVSAHRSLNTKRGVIRCPDLKECAATEVVNELANQGVIEAKKIEITKNGKKIPTGTFILTFNTSLLPKTLNIGYLRVRVDCFIPNPIRCFQCQKYGHFKSTCTHKAVCPKCGGEDHNDHLTCTADPLCINCKGNHPANAKDCPKWILEKSIQKLKTEKNLSYPEARRQLVTPATGVSYAQTVTQTTSKHQFTTPLKKKAYP